MSGAVAQRTIIARIKEHDLPQARRLMEELVASQGSHSTGEQVAKSLSNMAQQAKNYDIPELALEWSRAATIENPLDPMTHGHLADALIELRAFDEAEAALDQVQVHGDPLFAGTGRARIMRAQGRVSEAREAFVAIAKANENLPGVFHAKLGGAEALRELGDVQGALAEYRQLSIFYPEEPAAWSGLASTLVELGEIDGALRTYSKAAASHLPIARVGRAQALRVFGNLVEALALFDDVLLEYPRNHFALCGRADVLQDQGKLDLALTAYEQAMELSPYRIDPILGKINVLRHMNRFEEAFAVYGKFYGRFRDDRKFVAAPIAIYRAQGRFADSLAACDKLIAAFPFDMFGRAARASILGRLGPLDEAMAAYNAILAERPAIAGRYSAKHQF
jgi:tetratricopeptide (TPR) repeat protein